MRVHIWGARGSIPMPGPEFIRYGGNTPCVQVETDRELIILDAGTGLLRLGARLLRRGCGAPVRGHILLSHTHWDHIQGLPFFRPAFVPKTHLTVYGPPGVNRRLEEVIQGQMVAEYFPVSMGDLAAEVVFREVQVESFSLGPVRVESTPVNHPGLALGYRVSHGGRSLVYISDHEPYAEVQHRAIGRRAKLAAPLPKDAAALERGLEDFARGADLLILDSTYTQEEYAKRTGWGHSPWPYSVGFAHRAQVKEILLFHHEPFRNDKHLGAIEKQARAHARSLGGGLRCRAAREGLVVDLSRKG